MKMKWKLREKILAMSFLLVAFPSIFALFIISYTANLLEDSANDYMAIRVESFARIVDLRYSSIQGNLEIILKQLTANLKKELVAEVAKEKYFESGYMAIFQSDGTCVYHPDSQNIGNKELFNKYDFVRDAVETRTGNFAYEADGSRRIGYLKYNEGLDWIMWGAVPEAEVMKDVNRMRGVVIILLLIVFAGALMGGIWFARGLSQKANLFVHHMREMAQGEGDLTVRLPIISTDEFGDIAHWFNEFMASLEAVITTVRNSATQVDSATQEVSAGSQGLSSSTQEQASAIEQVAATIEEMTSSIKHNAENANSGQSKTRATEQAVINNVEIANELSTAMDGISEASKKIGDIIVTVNDVSFQTNLLALNAAVEAARAGEHGKGFAVVAEEVRALAQRSADAAKQIKNLIEDTVNRIAAGDQMAKKSGESLQEIQSHIAELAQTMEEIAAASAEQATGVDEVNRAIAQIDSTTQQNASTVEELASTADNLNTEARDLAATVIRFKVSQAVQASPGTTPKVQPTPAAPISQDLGDDDFEEF